MKYGTMNETSKTKVMIHRRMINKPEGGKKEIEIGFGGIFESEAKNHDKTE